MQPYVSLKIQSLAEGEQQRARSLFDTFSVGLRGYCVRRATALIAFASPYAMLSIAFGDKNCTR